MPGVQGWSGSGLLVLPAGGDWLVLREGSCHQEDPPRAVSVHGPGQCRIKERSVCISELAKVWNNRFEEDFFSSI